MKRSTQGVVTGRGTARGASRTILCLLAGGRGSRLGAPKALLRVGGEAVVAWQARRLGAGVPGRVEWWLSLAPGQAPPPGGGAFARLVYDAQAEAGPLAALKAALAQAREGDRLLLAPVDMLFVGPGDLARLLRELERRPWAAGTMGRWTSGPRAGRVEPFPCAWRVGPGRALLARASAAGVRGPVRLSAWGAVYCMPLTGAGDAAAWASVNTPADLAQARVALRTSIDLPASRASRGAQRSP